MKKIILFIFAIFCIGAMQTANAKGVIVYHTGPNLETIENLSEDAKFEDGTHFNLGVMYNQFGLFWMPVWNYGEAEYVLISDDGNTYYELNESDLAEVSQRFNLDIKDKPSPSLWNKIGLKPVLVILIVAIIWAYRPGRKKNEDA